MTCKVEILPVVWEDLKSIEDYCLLNFGSNTASKVYNQILESIENLEAYPDMGSATPDKWLNEQGYKMFIVSKKCIAIYRHIKDTVYIYHIFDTRRNYTKVFYE
ncbi:MAG: type II toxin-antitoxin system RelE/ParE family toxin [Erysipelotrichaceae bacterium]|nr:type II toxin-antitoxin system RelE/ParE family toxin [Erysipelotrichaceae bacterium]